MKLSMIYSRIVFVLTAGLLFPELKAQMTMEQVKVVSKTVPVDLNPNGMSMGSIQWVYFNGLIAMATK